MDSAEGKPKNYLIDMDGVLLRGNRIIPGADAFIERLQARSAEYLVLTNNPMYTPGDLAHRMHVIGLGVPAERIFTSAMATARFLQSQRANGTAFVIGESGLTEAIHGIGYVITDHEPDYVVLGETHSYVWERITKAVRLVAGGAHFIATNPDPVGPIEGGIAPACGAIAALIERATGKGPFFVGKPNPLMMRTALNYLGGAFGEHSDGWGSHGYGHHCRGGKQNGHYPRPHRRDGPRGCVAVPIPARAGPILRRRDRTLSRGCDVEWP
jgi:NagD protein